MSALGTRFMLWWKGELVGSDQFGNKYYRLKDDPKRRLVYYQGEPEASKVPPAWHRWLHHITEEIPPAEPPRQKWEKEHLPNLTGTDYAYRPPGGLSRGARRQQATGDYEAWSPE
ncbi:MAG: NADH:ubiquinone oxidoreductase subunit NDUFA12 [Alphaproteobacteria bacterium]|nr:NADH:ubiquinone oxidoreductase subunit NDUFA12 [Alphaproteobacteria bacterium]